MSRSPFAYPLRRNIDGDAGGAADLQTDIMRFMAILALCLMAIFALVQSIPLAPVAPPTAATEPAAKPVPEPVAEPVSEPVAERVPEPAPERVVLTRPKWEPTAREPVGAAPPTTVAPPVTKTPPSPEPVATEQAPETEGFTLRFESDQALMRLVATSQVGLYALTEERAQRMTVSSSRVSFWDASIPNTFHEMEATTVPRSVVDALARSGTATESVSWGVTLPGKLSGQLDELMRNNSGGSLLIGADGRLRLEAS
jgi:hypothetical protein